MLRDWAIVSMHLWMLMALTIMVEFAIGKKTVASLKSSMNVTGVKWVENMNDRVR